MTCSRKFGRLLQASCLGLIGTLTIVSCGGSETKPTPNKDSGSGGSDGGSTQPIVSLSVSPPSADFGGVVKGASSTTPTVITVTNKGAATSLTPAVTSGPFAVVSTTCGNLAALGTCTINLSFTPIAVGPASGVLTILPGTNPVAVTLTGTGVAPGAFTVTDKVDLNTVLVNATAPGTVIVAAQTAISGLTCTTSGADLVADPAKVCPATLAAGASCTFGFNFKATTVGLKNDSVVCSSAGVTLPTPVTAQVVTPATLAIQAPTAVSVSTPVGTSSSAISFNVVNSGGSSSGALTVTPTGDTTQFLIDNQCIVALTANNFCKINVVFKPTAAGAKTLTLTVTDASAPLTSLVATVNAVGTPLGSLTLTGTTDFGTVAVGQTSTPALVYTVSNPPGQTDTGPLTIAASDAQFVVSADGCSGLPLATGKSCTVSLVFKPTVAGAASATLSASAPGTPAAVLTLKGLATGAASLGLAPSTLDFAGVVVNAVSGTKTFTVTNTGQNATGALEVVKADSTSSVGGGSQFSYTTTCAAALLPHATCAVVVTFAPLQTGSASATITVRSVDRTVASQAGTLLGLGLATADLVLNCGTATATGSPGVFADTVVGVASNPTTCTLTNTAATASGAITPTLTGDFAITTDNCKTANLQNNTTCTMIVKFTPTAKGARTGSISVASVNSGSTNQQLSGNGLGIIEIQEYTTGLTSLASTLVKAGNYDFGQVTVGVSSAPTNLTLAVFVRAAVGNLAVTQNLGTPADFIADGTASGPPITDWAGSGVAVPLCAAVSPTAPPITANSNTVPYCAVVLFAKPSSKALKTGSVVATGANAQTDTGTFTVTGAGPITINPSPLTFASVAVGSTSLLNLTVKNGSLTTPVTAASYTLTGTDASQFVVVSDTVSSSTIAANGTANLGIRFVPTSTGAKTATITVSGTFGAVTETATVILNGTGGTPAQLTATLGATFADTAINAIGSPVTVTVSNAVGSVPTSNITYSATGEFTITPPGTATQGTCGASNSTPIAAAGTCTILVWFKPVVGLGLGKRTGTLTVSASNAGTVLLGLTANASAQVTASPSTLQDFGSVAFGDNTSATKTITFTNNASKAATLTVTLIDNAANPTKSDPSQFTVVTNTCAAGIVDGLGGTCAVTLQMLPNAAGVAFATLHAEDHGNTNNPGDQFAEVDITGTGLAQAALKFTSATAVDTNFGQIRLGFTSAPVTYTVTNTGDQTSPHLNFGLYEHSSTTLLHAKTSDFVMTGTTCSADTGIAGGASCNIVVTYSPTACAGGTCTGAEPAVDVDLIVKAGSATPLAGLIIPAATFPRLMGTATSAANVPFLVESTTSLSPYTVNLGTAATKTITMALHVGAAPIDASGLVGIANATATQGVIPKGDEFTSPTGATNTCTATQAANSICTFTVVWAPVTTSTGKREVSVSLGGATATIIAVVPKAAFLAATPTAGLNFGQVLQGVDSATLTLTVKNTGELDTAANLEAVKTGHVGEVTVLTGGCLGAPLAAGQSCTVSVKVKPSTTGAVTGTAATVTIRQIGAATPTAAMNMLWTGMAPAQITPSLSQYNFATSIAVGATSAPQTIALTNQDFGQLTGPLSISVDNTDFVVSAVTAAGLDPADCGNPTFAKGLLASGTCNIFVTFAPKALTPAAAKTATITVTSTSTAGTTVALTGTAKAALSVDVATATFTGVKNTVSATQTLTFTNAGGTETQTTGQLTTALAGANAAEFPVTEDNCTGVTLAPNVGCTVIVRFAPTTAGAKAATVTVSGTPGNSAASALAGTATNT